MFELIKAISFAYSMMPETFKGKESYLTKYFPEQIGTAIMVFMMIIVITGVFFKPNYFYDKFIENSSNLPYETMRYFYLNLLFFIITINQYKTSLEFILLIISFEILLGIVQ
jgi:hypothetical protein